MRDLTAAEQREIERRKAGFPQFFQELMPVLSDFIERLGAPDAPMVIAEPDRFIPLVDTFMKNQMIDTEDRIWIVTRVGYLIGEYLARLLGGSWYVNEVPDSRYFARYVVGRFARTPKSNACVDPMAIAEAYVSEPPGRCLTTTLRSVEQELTGYGDASIATGTEGQKTGQV